MFQLTKVSIPLLAATVLCCMFSSSSAFGLQGTSTGTAAPHLVDDAPTINGLSNMKGYRSRRDLADVFGKAALNILAFSVTAAANSKSAQAAMENRQTVFEVGKDLTVEQARNRFQEGQKSLAYLLDHWDDVVENGGGDNVRRYIGSVGTTSGLYGIQKVMKVLQDDADDIVEYTETMNEINSCINGVDGSAYMAIFVVSSTSQTPPEKYFNDAKVEAKRAQKAMNDLATQLKL